MKLIGFSQIHPSFNAFYCICSDVLDVHGKWGLFFAQEEDLTGFLCWGARFELLFKQFHLWLL